MEGWVNDHAHKRQSSTSPDPESRMGDRVSNDRWISVDSTRFSIGGGTMPELGYRVRQGAERDLAGRGRGDALIALTQKGGQAKPEQRQRETRRHLIGQQDLGKAGEQERHDGPRDGGYCRFVKPFLHPDFSACAASFRRYFNG